MLDSGQIDELWERFVRDRDEHTRNDLVTRYFSFVERTAKRIGSHLSNEVDEGDLIGYGSFGLIDAINEFDPKRGVKFETYAAPRVRGAMMDGLREMDDRPRLARDRSKIYNSLVEKATQKRTTGDNRHIDEIIEEIAGQTMIGPKNDQKLIGPEDLKKIRRDWELAKNNVRMSGFDVENDAGDMKDGHYVEDHKVPFNTPGITHEDQDYFRSIISKYPNKQARTLAYFYLFGDDRMKDVGELTGISESRVSQLMTDIVWFFVDYLHHHISGGLPPSVYRAVGAEVGNLDDLYEKVRDNQGAQFGLRDLLKTVDYGTERAGPEKYDDMPLQTPVEPIEVQAENNGDNLASLYDILRQTNVQIGSSQVTGEERNLELSK